MPRANLSSVMRYIRRTAGSPAPQEFTDAQLLEQYRCHRDGEAFAALVHRHAPLVRSVCRRILQHEHDAEDAFQASFLVLASKAGSIRKAASLASWLHGVAFRIAMRIRKTPGRKSPALNDTAGQAQNLPMTAAVLREAQTIVDDELNRLPEKYRAPFIMCCLEGKSRPEAARELGWKEGTVSSRIAQARKLLQQRLSRRGVVLSAVLCVLELSRTAAPAVGPALIDRTVQAALSFAAGESAATNLASALAVAVAKKVGLAMSATSKLKLATALLLACGFMSATGAIARQALSSSDGQVSGEETSNPLTSILAQREQGRVVLPANALNSLDRAKIAKHELKMAGGGDAAKAPAGLVAVLGDSRLRHLRETHQIAYTPDGKQLVSVGGDPLIRFWDPTTGEEIRRFVFPAVEFRPHPMLNCLAFSSDAKLIAAGGESHVVGIWDIDTGELKHLLRGVEFARSVAFHPSGKLLATTQNLETEVWDLASEKCLYRVSGHAKNFRNKFTSDRARALFTRDGTNLIVSHPDGKVRFWDSQSGKLLRTIDAHASAIHALNLSSDGRLLATGGEDSLAKVWDYQSGQELHRFQAASRVTDVAFQPNASVLATTGDTETALWDLETGQKLHKIEQPDGSWPIYLAFRPDGKKLATSGSRIRISDVQTGTPAGQLPRSGGSVGPVLFTPDGNTLIAGSADGTVRLWDLKTLKGSRVLSRVESGPKEMALSRKGDLLAILENHQSVVSAWNIAKETKEHVFKDEGRNSGNLAMSPDGKWLALCEPHPIESYRSTVRIWDQRSGDVKGAIQTSNNIAGLFFTPDGKRLIAAKQNTYDSYLEMWDVTRLADAGTRLELGGLAGLHGARR